MKKVYILFLGTLLFALSCSDELDEVPPNIATSDSLEDFEGVLNAAYFYQVGAATPMGVMGDFRADNALMDEEPFPEFDRFGPNLTVMEDQFFGPFYTALYKSILSANNVILNSEDATDIAEAKFLRANAYFKLVQVFGDVTINLLASPSVSDVDVLARSSSEEVYSTVIIPDLTDAIADLDNSGLSTGRATEIAAQALLGKVYVHRGNFTSAAPLLAAVVNGASGAGLSLEANYEDIFSVSNELGSEIIFAAQKSSSIIDEYGFSEFWEWYGGLDTKALDPLDPDLVAAFDAVQDDIINPIDDPDRPDNGDLRRRAIIKTITVVDEDDENIVFQEEVAASSKYSQADGPNYDWIEIRLSDIILLYAETLNENGSSPADVLGLLDDIRERAGLEDLNPMEINSQTAVRQAIQDERRLELAFEGHRWFDLVRTGTVNAEIGETVDPNYFIFPIPISEILATDGVITQNAGY